MTRAKNRMFPVVIATEVIRFGETIFNSFFRFLPVLDLYSPMYRLVKYLTVRAENRIKIKNSLVCCQINYHLYVIYML